MGVYNEKKCKSKKRYPYNLFGYNLIGYNLIGYNLIGYKIKCKRYQE